MKIENNSSMYMDRTVALDEENKSMENSGKKQSTEKKSTTIFAGDLNLSNDTIEEKKKQAQSMALGVLSSVFSNESKMDEDMAARNQHIQELKDENQEHNKKLEDISKEKENLKEIYGVKDDGDLSGLDEETQKAYNENLKMLNDSEKEYNKKIRDNTKEIYENVAVVRGTRIERLKTHDMVDAQKQSDKILEAASKDIIGTLISDVKEQIDERTEEEKEQAKEEEEKIEQYEKKEEEKEDNEEMYELNNILTEIKQSSTDETMQDVKKSLNQIVNELKLTADDLKGAIVDQDI